MEALRKVYFNFDTTARGNEMYLLQKSVTAMDWSIDLTVPSQHNGNYVYHLL